MSNVQGDNEKYIAKANLNENLQKQANEKNYLKATRKLFDYYSIVTKEKKKRRSFLK